jgi:creatinine amidohydrolase
MIWADLPSAALAGRPTLVALWPIGATEQHGPHLPSGTDTRIAESVCRAAVALEPRFSVLPALPVGCSSAHTDRWPGTLALMPRTLIGLVVEVAAWIEASGWSRVLMVNGHVGNVAPLRCAIDELRHVRPGLKVGLVNTWELGKRVTEAFAADACDWHANQAETSVMLALAPGLVGDPGQADDVDRTGGTVLAWNVAATSSNGVTGAPSRAAAEAGNDLLAEMTDELVRLGRQAARERAPVDEE